MRRTIMVVTIAWSMAMAAAAPADAKPDRPRGRAGTTLTFADHQWDVKSSRNPVGPGPNVFSADNAWVDETGHLHLRIDRRGRTWRAAEVILTESLGYGTYRFTVESPLDGLDPNIVLGLFTWSDLAEQHHREIDIEFSRWGDPGSATNAGYTVQPYDIAGNQHRWSLEVTGPTIHEFTWTERSVVFRSFADGTEIATWSRAGDDVPDPGDAAARINLWLFQGRAPTDGRDLEIVIGDFEFLPA